MKKELFSGVFQEFLQHFLLTVFATLKEQQRRKAKLFKLLHTALISNAFFDENKDKRKRYSLALKERNGRFSIY